MHRHFSGAVLGAFKRSVLISRCHDVYTNLALEDWLYTHRTFDDHNVLMLWSNEPCVVVGRYQNPWLEANVPELGATRLARRKSGGGTVYQDRGNLNITFFTSKKQYNRKANLQLVANAVLGRYGVEARVNERDDLLVGQAKISGTAAKLGRANAYHHCTLLVRADKAELGRALRRSPHCIKTNATQSTRSEVMNLAELIPDASVDELARAIGREYLIDEDFQYVDPDDGSYGDLAAVRDQLSSWSWCFGNTPKFTISKSLAMPNRCQSEVCVTVENGCVTGISCSEFSSREGTHVNDALRGNRFTMDVFVAIAQLLTEHELPAATYNC